MHSGRPYSGTAYRANNAYDGPVHITILTVADVRLEKAFAVAIAPARSRTIQQAGLELAEETAPMIGHHDLQADIRHTRSAIATTADWALAGYCFDR